MADNRVGRAQKRSKVKGCYECARRRIDCDRREPCCTKCEYKGLRCSGLGIRYRFNGGFASRGKLVGREVPDLLSYKKPPVRQQIQVEDDASPCWSALTAVVQSSMSTEAEDDLDSTSLQLTRDDSHSGPGQEVEGVNISDCNKRWVDMTLDHLNGETRWYLQYFSDCVAPVTAVIDMGFNGYRDLILPMAENDPIIRKAVILVAEQHLTVHNRFTRLQQPTLYGNLLRDLMIRSQRYPPHQDESTMTALLLLHIREMISGNGDFKQLYSTLRTLSSLIGNELGEGRFRLADFVKIQILRVCLFGESLFDENDGAQFLAARAEECFEFLRLCLSCHPELAELMSYLFTMVKIACELYVRRATHDPPPWETVAKVERFRQLTVKVDKYIDCVGRHLLAWPYFIVAAESSTAEHRAFFLSKLVHLHNLTKSGNISKALDQLHGIWTNPAKTRWTSLLGGPSQTLIM